jgi:amidase
MDELAFLTATEQADLVRRGEVTSAELVETYLERIDRLDPDLNAYVTVCADEARAAASGTLPDGPFRGVPLPIKDLNETAGIRTTFSSRAFADYVPAFDGAVVRRLKEAGFVVLGKTNTPELGLTAVTESELNGPCRNPWDPSRTPGGSSGGAAAAVAAGLAPAAQGSDGGGSIRIPASCCGLVGIKPARGRVSPAPYGGLEGFSTAGPITHGARCCGTAGRDGGLRDRRCVLGSAARASVCGGGRRRPRAAQGRADDDASDRRAGRAGVRLGRRGGCFPAP